MTRGPYRLILAVGLWLAAQATWAADAAPRVQLTTSMGDIVIELNPAKGPGTVANFLKYVQDGFYNGTIFHRVIDSFMIQGGGFTPAMSQKETRPPIKNEANNGLKNLRGTIAMARTSDPDSATSQFFINVKDNVALDFTSETEEGWGYCVFGKVVAGMDVVDKIRQAPTVSRPPFNDVPETPVVIQKAALLTDTTTTTEKSP